MNEEMNEKMDETPDDVYESENSELSQNENSETEEAFVEPVPHTEAKASKINSDVVKKVLIALICVVVIGASVGFGYFIAKNPADNSAANGTTVSDTENESDESPMVDGETDSTEGKADTDEEDDTTKTDGVVSGSDAKELKDAILGQWTDNANLSGYEFLEDGIVKVTYFNMSSLNLEDIIDGTYKGTYVLDGDELTVSYTIYSKAVTKKFKVQVKDNTLYMTSADGDEAVYVRKGAEPVVKTDIDSELLGKWSSNLSGYEFKENGVVKITYIDLASMGISIDINGTVDGVYEIEDNKLDIKFSIYSAVIEKKYTYSVDGEVLTLTDRESGEKGTYIKEVG